MWAELAVYLTHWGRETHIYVSILTIIGSDNGLSPGRRQAIIWTSAGILVIGPLGFNFSEILIEINTFSFNKMHLKMSSAKWRLFRLGLNELSGKRHDSSVWNGPWELNKWVVILVSIFSKKNKDIFAFSITAWHWDGAHNLTHWRRVTHICIGKRSINGRRRAIIWTNAGMLLIWPLGTNFSEILIEIQTFEL